MNGQWIIKEVYFEDGFPKIIRDLKPETPDLPTWVELTDEEIGVPTEPIQPNEAIMFARVIESLIKGKNT
jgi:hypothetical protein